jgi:putative FmdB family regulatory protein
MALYEYVCKSCGYEFEELKSIKNSDDLVTCKICGAPADKKMSLFASVVAGGSPNEPVDISIGREANKRWQSYHDRQTARRKDKTLTTVDIPKSKDGKYMPVMALGGGKDRERRQEYSVALQGHREERMKKGRSQFSDPGLF